MAGPPPQRPPLLALLAAAAAATARPAAALRARAAGRGGEELAEAASLEVPGVGTRAPQHVTPDWRRPRLGHVVQAMRMVGQPEEKVIFYNGRYGGPENGFLPDCPANCRVTRSSKDLRSADGVVWNEAGIMGDAKVPREKRPGQKWIFAFWFEPPNRNREFESWKRREVQELDKNGIIDWTMTWRNDSDFYWPSARLLPRQDDILAEAHREQEYAEAWKARPKLLLSLVSNCDATRRLSVLRRLQELLPAGSMDIFGSCGSPSPCRGRHEGDACHQKLFRQYRFVAAFENKRFQGYISEKVFRGLLEGMVPVALGGLGRSDYQAVGVPKEAMVHVDDFGSSEELAIFLVRSGRDAAPGRYFAWQRDLRVADPREMRQRAFCDVCRELHLEPSKQKPSRSFGDDLRHWWFDQREGSYVPHTFRLYSDTRTLLARDEEGAESVGRFRRRKGAGPGRFQRWKLRLRSRTRGAGRAEMPGE